MRRLKHIGVGWFCFSIFAVYFRCASGQVPAQQSPISSTFSAAVYKVQVWSKDTPTVPSDGTAFLIAKLGRTCYFVTAAHVILGVDATEDTRIERVVDHVVLFLRLGKGHDVEVPIAGIRIPGDWESTKRDFALLQVTIEESMPDPLPVASTPRGEFPFIAIGFPPEIYEPISIPGTVIASDVLREPWLLVNGSLTHGMSGGPALTRDGVFAAVQGRHSTEQELKYLVPLSLFMPFIRTIVPDTAQFGLSPARSDQALWDSVKGTNDPVAIQKYLSTYPKGRFSEQAKQLFQSAGTQLLDDAKALALKNGREAEAEQKFLAATDLGFGVGDSDTHQRYAEVLAREHKWDAALQEYRKASELNPRDYLLYQNIAAMYVRKKQWKAAIKELEHSYIKVPSSSSAVSYDSVRDDIKNRIRAVREFAIAEQLYETRQLHAAVAHYRDGFDEHLPEPLANSDLRSHFVESLLQAHLWSEAERNASVLIAYEPQQARWYYLLGLSEISLGKLDEAKAAILKAAALDPSNSTYATKLKSLDRVRSR
jgi:Flp pilus assembly protein TadD